MKRTSIIAGIILLVVAITAFNIVNKKEDKPIANSEPMNSIVNADDLFKTAVLGFTDNSKKDISYTIRRKAGKPVTIGILRSATELSDVIKGYPTNWIDEYVSTKVILSRNGMEQQASGRDQLLTKEQLALFNSVKTGEQVNIQVNYKMKNSVTGKLDKSYMSKALTVLPEVNAEFPGGYAPLITHLKNNSLEKVTASYGDKTPMISIGFTIDESGRPGEIKMINSSSDSKVDELLMNLIETMTSWTPAKDFDGKHVSQRFELIIGSEGC